MAKVTFAVKKYDGDDAYSYALFYKSDLPKGHTGPVFYGEAQPLVAGCSKMEAAHHKRNFEKKYAN